MMIIRVMMTMAMMMMTMAVVMMRLTPACSPTLMITFFYTLSCIFVALLSFIVYYIILYIIFPPAPPLPRSLVAISTRIGTQTAILIMTLIRRKATMTITMMMMLRRRRRRR